jgi:hypothetical protein
MTNCSSSATPNMQQNYQHPWYKQQELLENTTTSESKSKPKQKPETTGPKSTSSNRTGDYWEHHVMMKAWEKGAEIFPNLGCDGKTDMVLKIDGSLYEIDVKTMRWNFIKGCWHSSHKVHAPGVYAVHVNPETRVIRWAFEHGCTGNNKNPSNNRYQCPPGLEGFWD